MVVYQFLNQQDFAIQSGQGFETPVGADPMTQVLTTKKDGSHLPGAASATCACWLSRTILRCRSFSIIS